MNTVRVNFNDLGVGVTLYPATAENEAYAAMLKELTQPHQFALFVNRISDQTATRLMAEAFAKTVVAEYEEWDAGIWEQWFSEHPVEFAQVMYIAENPDRWKEFGDGSSN